MAFLTWHCPACRHTEQSGSETLLARLQSAGLLKRASRDERQDLPYLLALAETVAGQWNCPACGAAGLKVSDAEGSLDEFDQGQPCAACGKMIPPERMELFPETTLCTSCQAVVDRGGTPDTQEYCPRCGTRMQVRPARGAGVSHYALVCPQCRR